MTTSTFKTIKFKDSKYFPSDKDAIEFKYFYDIIDEDGKSEEKKIKISIPRRLSEGWGFKIWSNQPEVDYVNLEKMLMQIAKNKITDKLLSETLSDSENFLLLPPEYSDKAPFDAETLPKTEGAEFKIKLVREK